MLRNLIEKLRKEHQDAQQQQTQAKSEKNVSTSAANTHVNNTAPIEPNQYHLKRRISYTEREGSISDNLSSILLEAGLSQHVTGAAAARLRRQQFVDALDKELEKISKFYFNHERKFAEKQGALNLQIQELRNEQSRVDKDEVQPQAVAEKPQPQAPPQPAKTVVPSREEAESRSSIAVDRSMFVMDLPKPHQRHWTLSQATSSVADHFHHNVRDVSTHLHKVVHKAHGKVSKKKHLAQLKAAFEEHYRSLLLLQNYKITNYLGFVKILKKYDKYFHHSHDDEESLSESYLPKKILSKAPAQPSFYTSPLLTTLKTQTELLYTRDLYNNDRKAAMAQLRLPDRHGAKHGGGVVEGDVSPSNASFRSGIWLGMCLFTIVWWLIVFFSDWQSIIYLYDDVVQGAMYLFRLILFPIVMALLVAINIAIWDSSSINYVFIFEFDARRYMSKAQYLEVCLVMLLGWLLSSLLYMYLCIWNARYWGGSTAVSDWFIIIPVTFYVMLFLFLFNPFNFLYRRSRYWLLKTTARVVLSPLFSVKFKEFWLACQLTSLTDFLFGIQFFMCYATVYEHADDTIWQSFCDTEIKIGLPLLSGLPYWVRLMQCLRRFADSKQKHPHLTNAFVNFLQLLSTVLGFLALLISGTETWSWIRIVWIIESIAATTGAFLWDVLFDWNLFKCDGKAQYPCLRKHMTYAWYWYYLAIVQNIITRYFWLVVYLLRQYYPHYTKHDAISFFIVFVSLFRRFIWNIFRMEMEQYTNRDKFRAVQDVPLPFKGGAGTQQGGDKAFNFKEFRRLFCFICDAVASKQRHKHPAAVLSIPAAAVPATKSRSPHTPGTAGVRFADTTTTLAPIHTHLKEHYGDLPMHLDMRILDTLTGEGHGAASIATVPRTPTGLTRVATGVKSILKRIISTNRLNAMENREDEDDDNEAAAELDSVTIISDDGSDEDNSGSAEPAAPAAVRKDQIEQFRFMSTQFKSNFRHQDEDAIAEPPAPPSIAGTPGTPSSDIVVTSEASLDSLVATPSQTATPATATATATSAVVSPDVVVVEDAVSSPVVVDIDIEFALGAAEERQGDESKAPTPIG